MLRRHRNADDCQCEPGDELSQLVRRMNCACAKGLATRGAPMACELFRRVEREGQSHSEAAGALGLGPRDATYLLAGLRRDVAIELVTALLSGQTHGDPGLDRHPEPER